MVEDILKFKSLIPFPKRKSEKRIQAVAKL
jgi:hypothetical protein